MFESVLKVRSQVQPILHVVKVAIGATGAPTITSTGGVGGFSIARSSTGRYKLTIGTSTLDTVNKDTRRMGLFVVEPKVVTPVASIATDGTIGRQLSDIVYTEAAPYVDVQFVDVAGVVKDPANGATVYLFVWQYDTSLPATYPTV